MHGHPPAWLKVEQEDLLQFVVSVNSWSVSRMTHFGIIKEAINFVVYFKHSKLCTTSPVTACHERFLSASQFRVDRRKHLKIARLASEIVWQGRVETITHQHRPRVFCVPAKSAEANGGKAEKFLQHTFKEAFRLFLTFITRYNFSWPYACGVRTRCLASSSRRAHFKNFHLGTRGLTLTQLSARIHFPHCSVLTFYYIFRTVRCDNFVFYYIGFGNVHLNKK